LGHIGDGDAVGPLSQRLMDESPLVRRSAAYALGAMRARPAGSALIAALDDPDPQVCRNAAWGLGRIGDAAALPKLRTLRADTALDGDVADEAGAAILAIERPAWRRLPGAARNWLVRLISNER
jgi:HEAT repeat protein